MTSARLDIDCSTGDETTVALSAEEDRQHKEAAANPAPRPMEVNHEALLEQARQAHTENLTFLGVASPTNAQVVAQVKALTRQSNKLIRLVAGMLDGTS